MASLRATEKTACSARLGLQRSLCARPAALGTKRLGASPDARTPGTLGLWFQGLRCSLAVGFKGRIVVGLLVVLAGSSGRRVVGFQGSGPPPHHPPFWVSGREERRGEGRDRNQGDGGQITGSPSLTGPFLLLGGSRRSGREPIFLGVSTSPHGIQNLFKYFRS